MKAELFGLTREEIQAAIKPYGIEKFRAEQIAKWMYQHNAQSFADMTNIAKSMQKKLADIFNVTNVAVRAIQQSDDKQTQKYLLEFSDKLTVETVLMQQPYGNSVCVSSQIGCAMGCAFCASTIYGLERNLSAGEILAQVIFINRNLQVSGQKVNNIVIMGSGEPLANYENVVKFIRLCHEPYCLNMSYRSITLSTSGLVPNIRKLAYENIPLTLAISLHASNDETRSRLMPINKKYPIRQIIEAADDYAFITGRRVTYEYILISGINDQPQHAMELALLLKGKLANVNIIPVNPIVERGFLRPALSVTKQFVEVLERNGIVATVRREKGTDIQAACGQLRSQVLDNV